MESINLDWIKSWIAGAPLQMREGVLLQISYREPLEKRIVLRTKDLRPADLVLLANRLVWTNSDDDEDRALSEQDQCYVFWIRDSGIWNEVSETIASETFKALLRGYGQVNGTEGLLFDERDSRAAVVLALVFIIFGWDAYVIPVSGRFLCRISHDGYIEFRARDGTVFQQLHSRFSAWGPQVRDT